MDLDRTRLSYEAGIGAHIRFGKSFFLEPGVHYASTHATAEDTPDREDPEVPRVPLVPDRYYLHYLVMGGLRWSDALDVLAGGGVKQTLEGADDEPVIRPEVRVGIAFF